MEQIEYETFYGKSLSNVKDMDALQQGLKRLNMALKSASPQIVDRALALACKDELRAFAD